MNTNKPARQHRLPNRDISQPRETQHVPNHRKSPDFNQLRDSRRPAPTRLNRFAASLLLFLLILPSTAQETEIVYLSGTDASHTVEWEFFCTGGRNSGKWTTIPVPSNWELQGFGTYNYGHDWKNENRKLGKETGRYRHTFPVPAEWKGRVVNIVFDGAMTDCRVEVNGKPAGPIHQGAFYRFRYDISDLLDYGNDNLLEVDVAKHSANESVNRAERQADFWIFGGLFRPVFLEVHPPVHIRRAAIDARADGTLRTLLEVNQPAGKITATLQLRETDGTPVGSPFTQPLERDATSQWIETSYKDIRPWNPEQPQLYDLEITLTKGSRVLHRTAERFGFRTVELRPRDGFYVNGKKIVMKGVNRHSFWPETGRCLSEEHHLTDIRLMKEMNMNAVRMSHYVPDKRFLELCDSIGLLVLNEVTGWQDGYDTIAGPKLIRETVLRDENHPCVIAWNHGNEGGWNFANEPFFHRYDIQKRPVLYPWLLRNGVDTRHYIDLDFGIGRYLNGDDPFLPTEFLHGLYDGGHGAGLAEYWRYWQTSPLHAGGFLWVLADEAVLRTDMPGTVYDSDGNHAPDGIVGPHREKEGSFYAIKEIWSPVRIPPVTINRSWDGRLLLENQYSFTNLNRCSYHWKVLHAGSGKHPDVVAYGSGKAPGAAPGETAALQIDCHEALPGGDIFTFTVIDHTGMELFTWSWPLLQPGEKARETVSGSGYPEHTIRVAEGQKTVTATAGTLEITFDKTDGTLASVSNRDGELSLSGGPVPAGVASETEQVTWEIQPGGAFRMHIRNNGYPEEVLWTLRPDGWLKMEASPLGKAAYNSRWGLFEVDFVGVSFDYPEEKVTGVQWLGDGPYRVWKNRMEGTAFGLWEKAYNNTITGESFNRLIYPEFKGYHSRLYRATLQTTESDFTMITETPNLYFRLFTPGKPRHVAGGTYPPFPGGDLSFLYEIPPIGTKFKQPEKLGRRGRPGEFYKHEGDRMEPVVLWFDLRGRDRIH